jgi:hypothetical protein
VTRRGNCPVDQVTFGLPTLSPAKALTFTSGPSFLAFAASYLSPWLAVGIVAADLIASLAFTVEQSTG